MMITLYFLSTPPGEGDNPQAAGPGATTGLLAGSDREEGAGKGGMRL